MFENLTTSRQSSTKASEGWVFLNASMGHSSSTLCSVSAPWENSKCSYLLVIMILLSVPKQSIHPANIINVNKNLFSAQSVPYRIYSLLGNSVTHARTGGVLIVAHRRLKHTETIFNVVRQNRLHPQERVHII